MVIDTSVIIAILLEEPDEPEIVRIIRDAPVCVMSAASFAETGIVALGTRGIEGVARVKRITASLNIEVVPVTGDVADLAITAYERFGKGRHPAALNYGDCFSYALAHARGEPLLAKGEDFVRTDVAMAV